MKHSGLQALLEPVVTGLGYEFVGLEMTGGTGQEILRIYIDHADGISAEDCEAVSHQVSGVLDVEDVIPGQYVLEISSPGLDRPLFTAAQYRQFVGFEVNLRLKFPVRERRRLRGWLRQVSDAGIELEVDGEQWQVPFSSIERTRLVPVYPEKQAPRGGNRRR